VTQLELPLAVSMCIAALAEAAEHQALVSVAVVDGGGHLVAFQRMDGAEIAGPTLATDKAYTAVAHRIATNELTALTAPGGALYGMNANGGGRYVAFAGGLPLWHDGRVVGGVGVSGGTAEQDLAAARAAAALWDGD
jgi:uncharacterized protein GlcG (DUF336 family)